MKGIILAGGKGTRLYPVTLETPKPLLTVNKKPIINYLIDNFAKYGVNEMKIIIRPQDREDFEWWIKRYYPAPKHAELELVEEDEPMGTFGLVAGQLQPWLNGENFFLTNGDELKEIDLKSMAEHHYQNDASATLALVEVSNPKEYGVARLDGDQIIEFLEKPDDPPTNFISSGFYLLSPDIFRYTQDEIAYGQKYLMIEKDVFPKAAKNKKLFAYLHTGPWFDCGTLERWEKAIKEWDNSNLH